MAKKKTTQNKAPAHTTKKAPKQSLRQASASSPTLASLAARLLTQVKAIKQALVQAGLGKLSQDEREHSNGKLREGEDDAMTCVLDTVDAFPTLFQSIADKDHGIDDAVVETEPSRQALADRATLLPVLDALGDVTQIVSDVVLARGGAAKDVTQPSYKIITANAAVNPALARSAADALTFYGKSAKKGALTRKKNKKPAV